MRGDGGACILVVEDNAELRSYLAEAVRLLGYNVTTAESGDLALKLLARNQLSSCGDDGATQTREMRPAASEPTWNQFKA